MHLVWAYFGLTLQASSSALAVPCCQRPPRTSSLPSLSFGIFVCFLELLPRICRLADIQLQLCRICYPPPPDGHPMSARNTPLVPQPTGDTQYNVRDAALHGASSAFSKPLVKPKPQAKTYTGGGNGALLAAVKVGTSGALRTPASYSGTQTPLSRDWTGGSARSAARSHASPMQPLSTCRPSLLVVRCTAELY